MVSLSFANRFGVEHYIVEAQKHAVYGPFSNEAREKSSICCPKASGRFVSNAKKRRNPQDSGANFGGDGQEGRKIENVRGLPGGIDDLTGIPRGTSAHPPQV
jgi:hypothetical protein